MCPKGGKEGERERGEKTKWVYFCFVCWLSQWQVGPSYREREVGTSKSFSMETSKSFPIRTREPKNLCGKF